MTKAQFIITAAEYYDGYTEKKGNSGFNNASFEKELINVGWYKGAPWCAFFVKLIYTKAYKGDAKLAKVVAACNNGSAKQTLDKHKANGTFKVEDYPVPGAIVIWLHGKGPSGHAAIVKSVNGNTMTCIEGNTNAHGSREGDRVAEKLRTVSRDYKEAGLNIYGFIHPIE